MATKTLPNMVNGIFVVPANKIIAVVPEYCSGPGWSNRVLWVHIADGNTRTYRTEAIQPDERNRDQVVLFKAGEAMHQALIGSVVVKQEK